MLPQARVESIRALARRKAQAYAERADLAAVAITGSVARGTLWAGSDVDLWAFGYDESLDEFHDGVEETWTAFLEAFAQLPAEIREGVQADLEQEAGPVAAHGYHDGALRYLRALLPAEFGAEAVRPVLGIAGDLAVRRRRALRQVEALLPQSAS